MNVELREVAKDTVREVCLLRVRDGQMSYVASNALSIAQAYFEPSAVFRAVYLGEQPIGFVQWRRSEAEGAVFLWRFMIDQAHQAAGNGGTALALWLQEMKSIGFQRVETSVILGPASPLAFYLRQGFEEVGQKSPRGEWLLRRTL